MSHVHQTFETASAFIYNEGELCPDCVTREEERKADKERIRFLLTLMPPWVEEVPDGLDPTFYGTLSAAGDREVKAKVDAIRAAIESTEKQEGRR